MISELCKENARQFDFGLGAAFYKERFGDAAFQEINFCVFAASVRGVFLNALRLLTEGAVELARATLIRLKLEQKLKTAWRRRITPALAAQE
jgi:CelD/BcsL family acetyltransferase involved in cellulose biosynthesis